MNPPLTPQALAEQILQIQRMEHGCLCVMGHGPNGPYYNLNSWENGKNHCRYLPQDKVPAVQQAIAGYQKYQQLTEQYARQIIEQTRVELNIGVKKKPRRKPLAAPRVLLAQEQEIQQLMTRFQAHSPKGADVQQLEVLIRTAVFKSANQVVGYLLQAAANRADAEYQAKAGEQRQGRQALTLQCLFGVFTLWRDYYYHPGKKQGHCPADAALGLEGSYTPALARLICLEGADCSHYRQAQNHLAETGGIEVSARQIQRVVQRVGQDAQHWQEREVQPAECARSDATVFYLSADGSGAPMRQEEVQGRAGKQSETAKTRQVYLGCVFTQHKVDEEGHPIRDYDSTTYLSSLQSIHEFGPMLRREALRRGMGTAEIVVLLIDGAEGLAHMGQKCFANAIQIVDFYHATEHAGQVLVALLGSKEHPDYRQRQRRWAKDLLKDRVQKLIDQTRKEAAALGRSEAVEKELGYFVNNIERMQYGTFRKQGFFIGSGVVEAGCKTIIGSRCKQSGMFWSVEGAENILAFRCIHNSRRLDSFWKYRLNTHAARNDILALAT